MHDVVIAGGGPTGMMLGVELTLAGADVLVVERRAGHELDGARARGIGARTIEVLDQRGVAERFVAEGQALQILSFANVRLDLSDFPSRHPYGLALLQPDFERILAGWIAELGVPVLFEREVTGCQQDGESVDVALSDGSTLRTQFLVGCDSGRSVVRRSVGIDFPGMDPTMSFVIAEVDATEEPVLGLRPEGGGIGPLDPSTPGGPYGMVVREQQLHRGEPDLADLRNALIAIHGTDFGVQEPMWLSRFTDATRQAAAYRADRVLLAGDAAHIHQPQGGQGLNTGVQDAVNLGWKLAQVARGTSPDTLLDSYHDERHPVGAWVQRYSMSFGALALQDQRHQALLQLVGELVELVEPRRHLAGMLSGLGISYDLGGGHPLVGRRMPDLDLVTTAGPTRAFTLLHEARPLLLSFASNSTFDLTPWAATVRLVEASTEGPWELPVIGAVDPPAAVLIRPDGHVAWAGDLADPELPRTLDTWFGMPERAG